MAQWNRHCTCATASWTRSHGKMTHGRHGSQYKCRFLSRPALPMAFPRRRARLRGLGCSSRRTKRSRCRWCSRCFLGPCARCSCRWRRHEPHRRSAPPRRSGGPRTHSVMSSLGASPQSDRGGPRSCVARGWCWSPSCYPLLGAGSYARCLGQMSNSLHLKGKNKLKFHVEPIMQNNGALRYETPDS